MLPLPPLNFNSAANSSARTSLDGASFAVSGPGDWNVNLGGSGAALQSAGVLPLWLMLALAVGGVWLICKR